MSPGISCIIPVYNAERYLAEAIESVLAQTLLPEQIIVVDDGSTDGSAEVARSYADRITFAQQENRGTAVARNHGLRLAECPFIAFLDADDLFLPDKLAKQMQQFDLNSDLDLCITQAQNFWSPDVPEQQRCEADLEPKYSPGQASTWLARRRLFDRIGVFNTDQAMRFAQGSEFFLRSQESGAPIKRIGEVLVKRRLHTTNDVTNRQAHLESIMMLMKQRADQRRKAT